MKKLKLFNGAFKHSGHIYIAAYSMQDAADILAEAYGGNKRGTLNTVRVYFSKGCWGNSMEGITPERGAWVQDNYRQKPYRVV